jgi:serine/threonine protein kinase
MAEEENTASLQPGTVIAGRYEVIKCLGAGSMGMVYACRHRELSGHKVAVKVLFPEVARDRVAAQRFKNEVFASYGVSHPYVVRAYEFVRDGDLVAYTMEFVGGGDLADRLSEAPHGLLIPDVIRFLKQMCLGVQAIHDAHIVHRDLKPENILLTSEGSVKIADFGIARQGNGPKLTEHGGVVGTLDYVSPEYLVNSQVDAASDIYALGVLAYEMVTGELPFQGDTVYSTMTRRLKEDPTPAHLLRSECPEELAQIIQKAMQRDPKARFSSAYDMAHALDEMQGHTTITPHSTDPLNARLHHNPVQNESSQSIPDSYSPALRSPQPRDYIGIGTNGNHPTLPENFHDDEYFEPDEAESPPPSFTYDVLTVVIAIFIGVGIGFLLLRNFLPSLLNESSISSESVE